MEKKLGLKARFLETTETIYEHFSSNNNNYDYTILVNLQKLELMCRVDMGSLTEETKTGNWHWHFK